MLLSPKNRLKFIRTINALVTIVWIVIAIHLAATNNPLTLWMALPFVLSFLGLVFSILAYQAQK